MAINIEMPKLSETMTEGILLRWNKNVGDYVDVGEIIAEVETDKATISIECYDDGYLIEQCACEGTKVPVGDVIAKLDSNMPGVTKAPLVCKAPVPGIPKRAVSPLARKLAGKKGIDLHKLVGRGSGPKRRVMAADILSWKDTPIVTEAPVAPQPAKAKSTPGPVSEDQIVPLSQRQKFVAEATVSAKSNTPHYYVTVEVDVTAMEKLREQVNETAKKTHGHHFTFNDFVIRALINACKLVPSVNSSFDESKQAIVHHSHVGINVAVDANGSVLIPVLKNAEKKTMMKMSAEVKDLAARAKENKLLATDFEGGTITLTNIGGRGVEHFYAIINEPQAAIVSVGGITEKPVVRKGAVVVGQCVSLSMSCDHRVVSGTDAAKFLDEMKTLMETPSLLLV